jgi:23S rRNA pseudouridine2604 synthase
VTILLNKPIGYVSAQPEKGYTPAIMLINASNQVKNNGLAFNPGHRNKLAVVGRLDIDSKGLLILSQDGVLVKKIIGPESLIEKEYLVRVEGNVSEEALRKLRFGLYLDGKALKRAKVDLLQNNLLKIVLIEGKKRQIRRMCDLVGLKVVNLKRVRIGNVLLGDLPEGKWRFLRADESF